MASVIPLSAIVNVTVAGTPQGVSERNVNDLVIFTNETPSNNDVYRIYRTSDAVAADYGTESKTADMARNIFAQSFNILSGNGLLYIVPMQSAVSATSGYFETASLTSNIAALTDVTDGDLRVTTDGVNEDLTGVNFSNASDIDDIAQILSQKLRLCSVAVKENDVLEFTSKKVGAVSEVELAQLPTGTGTDLSGASLLNVAGGTAVAGADSSGESILDAVLRIQDELQYTGFMTTLNLEDEAIEAIADDTQARARMFFHHVSSPSDIDGIITTISSANQTKTRLLYYGTGQADANMFKASYVGRALSVNTRGTNTAIIMHGKQLENVSPDPTVALTQMAQLREAGADFYGNLESKEFVVSTGGNGFFDNVYRNLALEFAAQTALINTIIRTNTKVPQTEAGMSVLLSECRRFLDRFVNNGYLAPGTWNAPDTFGDKETFLQNIEQFGYYIYYVPIAQQDPVEREERRAPLLQIAVKSAGGIQYIDTIININE